MFWPGTGRRAVGRGASFLLHVIIVFRRAHSRSAKVPRNFFVEVDSRRELFGRSRPLDWPSPAARLSSRGCNSRRDRGLGDARQAEITQVLRNQVPRNLIWAWSYPSPRVRSVRLENFRAGTATRLLPLPVLVEARAAKFPAVRLSPKSADTRSPGTSRETSEIDVGDLCVSSGVGRRLMREQH